MEPGPKHHTLLSIFKSTSIAQHLSLYIYIYIRIHLRLCIYLYVYIYHGMVFEPKFHMGSLTGPSASCV